MRIIADENIPLVQEFFADIGKIKVYPGRDIKAKYLKEADVLLVRSVTQVNADLLQHSGVRFVGTSTIGTDHIDLKWLKNHKIAFANAPGSNAESVVEYVLSALVYLEEREGFELQDKTLGIIGAGNVGGRLYERLHQIGVKTLINDPPLQAKNAQAFPEACWADLDTLLEQADIISLHTPLISSGAHPTHHLLDKKRIQNLAAGKIIINSGRGAVIDTQALKKRLQAQEDLLTVLDVWEQEPHFDTELVKLVTLATPHIAGYSLDGKLRGTEMVCQSLCQHFGLPMRKQLGQLIPEPPLRKINFSAQMSPEQGVRTLIRACYDVRSDDLALRLALRTLTPAQAYDQLRRDYPVRREFANVRVELKSKQKALAQKLMSLGFKVKLS